LPADSILAEEKPECSRIVEKLDAPSNRDLGNAKKFFGAVRERLRARGASEDIGDIYSGKPLEDKIHIDHFLPWSFVVHDELWNLVPVNRETNILKKNSLPNLERYLPCLSRLHWNAIRVSDSIPEDYIVAFRLDACDLSSLSFQEFSLAHERLICPQAQIAQNMGFKKAWDYPALCD
jgi:hypothetical protein